MSALSRTRRARHRRALCRSCAASGPFSPCSASPGRRWAGASIAGSALSPAGRAGRHREVPRPACVPAAESPPPLANLLLGKRAASSCSSLLSPLLPPPP